VILVHAKDIAGPGRDSQAAGRGLLDWSTYLGLLQKYKCEAPVILHGLSEAEVTGSVSFVREALRTVY
jgi:sugar phosphate isomerase/epimerase